MTTSALALVVLLSTNAQFVTTYSSATISRDELEEQKTTYKKLWDEEFVTRLTDLPIEGKVPEYRVPYSGHDYPDKVGGTLGAMAKYDRVFHRGYSKAYKYEAEDLAFHRSVTKPGPEIVSRGMFGRVISVYRAPGVVPIWYGHCNGWTAASIRHAEPQKSIVRNGLTITPAEIKGMLAELYMYSHTQSLGGQDEEHLPINPGTLHLALANWIGRRGHPIAMETAIGEPVINFPIHAYKSTVTKWSPTRFDVRTLITYSLHTPREYDKGPKSHRTLYFHYILDTDAKGNILAGYFQRDSAQIDMVWIPLHPVQGGEEGNRGGNPHLDIKEVLALWQESVPQDLLKKWTNVDPTDAERALVQSELPKAPAADDASKPAGESPAAAPAVADPPTGAAPAPTPAGVSGPATPAVSPPPAPRNTDPPPPPRPVAVPGESQGND